MIDIFKNHLSNRQLILPSTKVLVACSGGADSIALADLLWRLGYDISLAHVNFQLRGDASDGDEAFVREFAETLKVPFFSKRFETSLMAEELAMGIQETARFLRYTWFHELLQEQGIDVVATAHHQDDLVETYLMHILRGSSLGGFTSIPEKNGSIIRPLLVFTKAELLNHLHVNEIPFREDSSNDKDEYTRNKVRHHLIPLMEDIRPGFARNILRQVAMFNEINPLLKQLIDNVANDFLQPTEAGLNMSIEALQNCPFPRLLLTQVVFDYGFKGNRIDEVIRLLGAQNGKYLVSDTHKITKERNALVITTRTAQDNHAITIGRDDLEVNDMLSMVIEKGQGKPVFTDDSLTAVIDLEKISFPLTIRHKREGDKFIPLGMTGFQKLSDFFIQRKLTNEEKRRVWILTSGEEIVWVVGYRIDERYKVKDDTKEWMRLRIV